MAEVVETGGRVILLTSPGLPQRLLAQRFHRQLGLDGIVVERRKAPLGNKASGLKRRLIKVLGRSLFDRLLALKHRWNEPELERRVRLAEDDLKKVAERELLTLEGPDPGAWPDVTIFETERVNRPQAVEWVAQRQPDLLVVYGTSILKQAILQVPRLGVLNAHSSILPHHRGVFSEFWQVLRDELQHAGVTVHRIDLGVDTGDLIAQAHSPTTLDLPDLPPMRHITTLDPYRLRTRNVVTTLDIYPRAAAAVLRGDAIRTPQPPSDAPTFRSRDLTFERRLELLRHLGMPL